MSGEPLAEGEQSDEPPDRKGFEFNPAVAAIVAVFVAVLGATGIAGDGLTRAVRNHPNEFGRLLLSLLVAVGLFGFIRALWLKAWLIAAVEAAVVVGLVFLVLQATDAVAERENPLVALSATTDDGVVTITVTARASGLASDSDMLVQVQSLTSFPGSYEELTEECGGSKLPPTAGLLSSVDQLWLWEQAGPDADGVAELASSFEMPAGEYEAVCAYAALKADQGSEEDYRFEFAVIRLRDSG